MSATRVYTFRDAGLHSRLLKTLNAVGGGLRGLGIALPNLAPDRLIDAARKSTGLEDLGHPGYREGLDVLTDAIEREAAAVRLFACFAHVTDRPVSAPVCRHIES